MHNYSICVNGSGIVLGILFHFLFCFFWLEVVLGLSRLRSGETSGEMQVACTLDTKTCCKKQMFPSISVFSVCVFMYVYVCVCVCVCSICLFFLLLFCLFIQCTSFLVFAIYLFNV